jgi:hypothetical protein
VIFIVRIVRGGLLVLAQDLDDTIFIKRQTQDGFDRRPHVASHVV